MSKSTYFEIRTLLCSWCRITSVTKVQLQVLQKNKNNVTAICFGFVIFLVHSRLTRLSQNLKGTRAENITTVAMKDLGPVSRKSQKLFRPEKPFVKLWPAYSVKLVFSYVVKRIKIKITAKFCASIRLRFEDTKIIMSPKMCPTSFGTFEKQAPGLNQPFTYFIHVQIEGT